MTGGGAPRTLVDRVLALAADLRAAGVDNTIGDTLDAVAALGQIGLGSRTLLRAALQATLITRAEDVDVFAVLFDRHFPVTVEHRTEPARSPSVRTEATSTPVSPQPGDGLVTALADAVSTGDDDGLAQLAVAAVDAYAGIGVDEGGERYFLYRVLRALDLSNLLVAVMARLRSEQSEASGLARRQLADDVRERIERFRRLLAATIRSRMAAPGTTASHVPVRRIEDVAVMTASTTELRQLRAAVRPLARRLASRIGQRRRRHRRGRLDVRRTIRRSLDAGGTPLDPAFRRARPTKPQLVVLCDISGSVAEFARFTLLLLHALHAELAGLRAFAFVDGVAELTTLLAGAEAVLDPRLLVTLPGVVDADGHSDYERALRLFVERHGAAVGPSTTVLITGDARTNYRGSGVESLREIRGRCRRLYWFNPEPAEEWDTGDSAVADVRAVCDEVFEVRTLAQLGDAVAAII